MEYKVIPFVATVKKQNISSGNIAQQLEDLIKTQTAQGWEYIRLENVSTYVQPVTGCFDYTSQKGYMAYYQMAVFTKKENEASFNSSH